jgi:hypothetical protein
MNEFKYVGSELDLFATVCNWNAYWSQQIRPFLRGDILEVGAGIGSNTRFLDRNGGSVSRILDMLFLYSVGKTIIAVWRLTTINNGRRSGS